MCVLESRRALAGEDYSNEREGERQVEEKESCCGRPEKALEYFNMGSLFSLGGPCTALVEPPGRGKVAASDRRASAPSRRSSITPHSYSP